MGDGATHRAPFRPDLVRPPAEPYPPLKAIRVLTQNPIEVWPEEMYRLGCHQRTWLGKEIVYTLSPEAVRTVFLDEADKFAKGVVQQRILRPMLGEGLITAEGAHWRWQRRAAAPAFRHDRILALAPRMAAASERALERWRLLHPDGAEVDTAAEMVRVTFDIILDTMLSGGAGIDPEEAGARISRYLESAGRANLVDILGGPEWLRGALAWRGRRAMRDLRAMVSASVAARLESGEKTGDLIDLLAGARDPETGREMRREDLVDNILTFIGAGHETTALALAWTFWLVANDPETEGRVLAEIADVAGEAPITAEHVERLVFTKQVIQDSMRLLPPVAALSRECLAPTEIAGEAVSRGARIVVPIWILHRHRDHWEDPDAFIPDRFAPDRPAPDRHLYMPFGAGPRICIGMGFAMIEAVAVFATLLRRVRFTADADRRVRPLMRITLRPEGGLPMRLDWR